jgi:dihydrofolate reductase
MSRVATTPSWWRRFGAMTCATLGWSSSTSAASTTFPASWLTSRRQRGGGSGSSSITWCLGARSRVSRDRVRSGAGRGHVLVLGHPYVDIWEAVKPAMLGLASWPEVPITVEWKHGICAALGLPHRDQADLAAAWRMILDKVRSWDDLRVTRMRSLPATVVSTTLDAPLDWPDATVANGDAVDVVARLKEESAVPLRSSGSLSMNRALMAAGLVDRIQLTVFPVITGQTGDDPIFLGAADFDLELIDSRTLEGNIQELVYRPTLHA